MLLAQKFEGGQKLSRLRESLDLGDAFDSALKAAGWPVLITSMEGALVDANQVACYHFNLTHDQFVCLDLNDLLPSAGPDFVDRLQEGLKECHGVHTEADCLRLDGSCFPVEISTTEISLSDQKYMMHIVRDETRSRETRSKLDEAQRRIARAERLETSGTVAGQIAHDFNNLLSPLLAYPYLIRKDLPEDSTGRQYLDVMDKTVNDMAHMTDQLLALSRRGQFEQRVFNLNDVVEHVLTLMESRLEGISVATDLAADLMDIKGAHGQLVRVIQNLCHNASDAMGENGRLVVSTRNVYLDDPVGSYDTVEVGEYVKLSVEDSGGGIPEDIADKIFDPFFTTKKSTKARGSGLGLSVVHGIIKDHDGYIDLVNQAGVGACFNIYFPIYREDSASELIVPDNTETILVIDDDQAQVDMMVGLLTKLGYSASGLTHGDVALKSYAALEPADRPELVIVDLLMSPGPDGIEVASDIRKINPDQRFLAVSGHKEMKDSPELIEAGLTRFLGKPFTYQVLSKAVRAAVGKADPVTRSDVSSPIEPEAEREAETVASGTEAAPSNGNAHRIMIVDDEDTIRRLFEVILTSELENVGIDVACNGAEAVDCFSREHHDVILMDLHMPVLDGKAAFTQIEKLCKEHDWDQPAVVFCTGFAPPGLGKDDHCRKSNARSVTEAG